MDRRLRSPARRPAAPRADERKRVGSPHRFLRPGALARLRDSRIVARSIRSAAAAVALPPSSSLPPPRSPTTPASHAAADGVPCFLGAAATRGMRYPLRKKLAAARSVVFLPPPQQQHEAVDVFPDVFVAASSDLVAAH